MRVVLTVAVEVVGSWGRDGWRESCSEVMMGWMGLGIGVVIAARAEVEDYRWNIDE